MKLNYNQLSDKAYELHKNKKTKEAEILYLELLKIKPDDYNVLNLLGLLYISDKQDEKAIKYLTKAYVLKKTAYIATNLGKAYYFNGQYDYAIKIFEQALNLEKNDDIYFSIALAYKKKKCYEEAIDNYKKAYALNTENYKVLYNMALTYKLMNEIDSALNAAEKSASLCNNDEEVFTLLSSIYEEKNDYENAIVALQKAIAANPQNHIYFYNLGVLYSRIDNIQEAIIAYNTCIRLDSTYIEAYVNVALLYKKSDIKLAISYLETAYKINDNELNLLLSLAQCYKDSYENQKSFEVLDKIIEKYPDSAEAYSLYAINLMDISEYEKAFDYYNKAISIAPDNPDYLHGLAISMKYLGKYEEAKSILETLISNNNVSNQTLLTLGMMYLSEKQLKKGYSLYRNRNKDSKLSELFKEKLWNPEVELTGKSILLYSDCGLGDTIMYSRYIPNLLAVAKKVILQTDKELVDVLKSNFSGADIIKKSDVTDEYDIVMSIMDLQFALNLDFSMIPSVEKYLDVSSKTDVINKGTKKKIGLFWQGNKRVFKNRSIQFEMLNKLLENKKLEFYSFQLNNENVLPENVIDLSPYINDYNDTATLLKNIDILITIDSSIAHMAGALGVKTFLMLPKVAEWRWFDDVEKSSWYSSVKIFRQSQTSNWDDVIKKIDDELKKYE